MMSRCPIPQTIAPYFFGLPIPHKRAIAVTLALLLDALDLMLIGTVPVLGLLIDTAGLALLIPLTGVPSLLVIAEILADLGPTALGILPVFTIAALLSIHLEKICLPA